MLGQVRLVAPLYPGPVYIDFLPLLDGNEPPYPLIAVATWKREGTLLMARAPVADDPEARAKLREDWSCRALARGLNLKLGVIDTRCWPLSSIPQTWTVENRAPEPRTGPGGGPAEEGDGNEVVDTPEQIPTRRGNHMADDVLSVLQQALTKEEQRQAFYEDAAQRSCNPLAQRTFSSLAAWEAEHAGYVRAYYDKMQEGAGWPDPSLCGEVCRLAAEDIEQILAAARDAIDGEVTCDTALTEAYKLAMEGERESIDFYSAELERATDPNARAFYEVLLAAERGHLELLANTEQFLDNTEAWYFDQEQWTVEG